MDELFEKLAAIEHERWSDWQRYLHSKCIQVILNGREALVIPGELQEQWERQIATPYADLTEKEKESDRVQVRRYWDLINDHSFQEYVDLTNRWLEKYPADIFTGESGDAGPLFAVAIRKAVADLETTYSASPTE